MLLNVVIGNVILYSVLGVIGAIVLICLLLVMFTPRHVHVERSITIHAPPEKIYDQIATLEHWLAWSPWFKRDPDVEVKFNDVPRGKGARYEWSGNKHVGVGEMEIVGADEPHRIDLALLFGPKGDGKAYFELDPVPAGEVTEVTWGFDTDMGVNPISRFFGLLMDRFLGPDYEQGLASLKEICEQQ